MKQRISFIVILILIGNQVFPQSSLNTVQIICNQPLPADFNYGKNKHYVLKAEGSTDHQLALFFSHLYDLGYLESTTDSIVQAGAFTNVYLTLGRQFRWLNLNLPVTEHEIEYEIPDKLIPDEFSEFSLKQYHALREYLIREYENQGYPFVSVRLDSIKINENKVEAKMLVDPRNRVVLDSLIIRSELPVSERILQRISGLRIGDWYSEQLIVDAQKRLQNSGFINMQRPLEVGFFKDKAWVYLSPEMRKTNRIDGLIGILPAQGSAFPSIAGEFNLILNNIIRQAESLTIQWKAPGAATQKLNSQIAFPYIFGLPIGISGKMDLYKKDTSFLNLGVSGGLRISIQPGRWLDVLYENRSSSGLANDLSNSYPEFDLNLSKMVLHLDNRDNPLNPGSGWLLKQEVAYGRKSRTTTGGEYEQTNYWEMETEASLFLPFRQNWTFLLALNGGLRSGRLASNEQFRIGGYTLMRGFQEESLLTSSYAVATAEIRLLLAGLSNIHLFFDYGIIENNGLKDIPDTLLMPYSPGVGLSIQTKAGILRLDYALGQYYGQGFDLQNGLIHLGIQSIF
ncbi:MAG: BamA/TamA family outer membrane protein [Bacteroidota bacterium]|nr:BamA/TamA family outer membrane protein [Bacteroidota bacterium]